MHYALQNCQDHVVITCNEKNVLRGKLIETNFTNIYLFFLFKMIKSVVFYNCVGIDMHRCTVYAKWAAPYPYLNVHVLAL